jgi:hypothetical protein
MKKIIVIGALSFGIVGCASVPMGDPQQDAALKTFHVPANQAGIYVYRTESIGGAVKMDVAVDGAPIGQTAAKTFLYKEVAPGKHEITSKAENTDALEIDAKPGTLTYVWQEVKMGFMFARNKLHLMSETEGKSGVMETQLAATK